MNPPPKLTDQEKHSIVTYFGSSSQDQSVENSTKIIMNHLLKRRNGKKSSTHPSAHAMTPTKILAVKVYSIGIK